jgi:hypothetical protein
LPIPILAEVIRVAERRRAIDRDVVVVGRSHVDDDGIDENRHELRRRRTVLSLTMSFRELPSSVTHLRGVCVRPDDTEVVVGERRIADVTTECTYRAHLGRLMRRLDEEPARDWFERVPVTAIGLLKHGYPAWLARRERAALVHFVVVRFP